MIIENDYYDYKNIASITRKCVGDDGHSCWNLIYATIIKLHNGEKFEYFKSSKEYDERHIKLILYLKEKLGWESDK